MATKKKHHHKLKRHTYRNGEQVYFCVLDCTFRVKCELAEGLIVICHRCDKPFAMTQSSCELAKPHCNNCTRSKKREADEILAALEPELVGVGVREIKNEIRMDDRKESSSLEDLRKRLSGSVKEILDSNSDDML